MRETYPTIADQKKVVENPGNDQVIGLSSAFMVAMVPGPHAYITNT
jgi:hypothetical protein